MAQDRSLQSINLEGNIIKINNTDFQISRLGEPAITFVLLETSKPFNRKQGINNNETETNTRRNRRGPTENEDRSMQVGIPDKGIKTTTENTEQSME